jgi:hypothetical protein
LLDRVPAKQLKTMDVVKQMSTIMEAEESYLRFVTDNGKRVKGLELGDSLKHRRITIGRSIAANVKRELIRNAKIGESTSVKEAESRFDDARSEADSMEKKLAVKLFKKGDKAIYATRPTKARLARLGREEKQDYRAAMDSNIEPKYQIESIQAYLKKHKTGKHRAEVEKELGKAKERAEALAKKRAEQLKLLLSKMSGKKTINGRIGYKQKTYRVRLKVTHFNKKSGAFSGRLSWLGKKGAVNRVKGRLDKDDITMQFKEVAVIKKGKWLAGSQYTFSLNGKSKLRGTHTYRYLVFPEKRTAVLSLK